MRKVVLYTLTSIDGVAESPDRYVLDFDDRMRENLAHVVSTQDAVILGRRSFDDWAGYWPSSTEAPFAPFINGVDKYVLTSTEPALSWDRTTMVTRPVRKLVNELRSQAGGDIGVHGSISLAQSMLVDGLIDELRLVVTPTVAGRGRHLFDGAASRRQLTLLESEATPSGALLLCYRVAPTALD
ncbi:dihydrofolate reductase family protein [Ruania halotolerans]|uniref:dihydrofolate reductase family protein n=1 Tax=Ruania halotolerans TaxID=2897773 RepID=UPI001E2F2D7A|nr:dihydrofolate reductase family protein [Ruania halotolerans]UFU06235.1 dihydrofolate reductase family protein [Ruania halotolerans]